MVGKGTHVPHLQDASKLQAAVDLLQAGDGQHERETSVDVTKNCEVSNQKNLLVDVGGVEPPPFRLSAGCTNHLCYTSM